jgi:GT2 family glycosyltransferase
MVKFSRKIYSAMSAFPKINPSGTLPASPFWSVMIPTYRPDAKYLRQTLESILQQDSEGEQMHVEVVDDSSPGVDVATLVKSIAGEQVQISRTPKNLGLAGCWNTCIERSRGQWVHILHQDDFVLQGFYKRLAKAAQLHPEVSLLATRSFFVDEEGVIQGITPRLHDLENGGRAVDNFYYTTPIQCPGVVVKRSFYETHGGFRPDLSFVLDCEMWARVIGMAGGLVTSEALACYRVSDINETGRLGRTAEGLHDLNRLNKIFSGLYPGFDCKKATLRVCNMALDQAGYFSKNGDAGAARANLNYWKNNAPVSLRLRRIAWKIGKMIFG